jgi:hypothetical protein
MMKEAPQTSFLASSSWQSWVESIHHESIRLFTPIPPATIMAAARMFTFHRIVNKNVS